MDLIIVDNYEELSQRAADIIASCVEADPACTLGLATGTSPIGLYAKLVEKCQAGEISFKDVTTFNLDEYRGLNPEHNQSYRYFMNHHLFDKVDINKEATHVPDGADPDAEHACAIYEQLIERNGGIDLQLLGLGHNGHIGFNEPQDDFPAKTHLVQLTQRTIEANSRLFDSIDDVPREAYTMGIGTIMAARSILLVATGSSKAQIVHDVMYGLVTPQVPASILKFHPNVTIIVDKEAGALCQQ
ncbi:MAG: glucosamine-6-phosphate deaminase [Coriobacteriia bacterium]|nr:glucosamine-6-phosphate deaminase [Coriobacteriia bacterium]